MNKQPLKERILETLKSCGKSTFSEMSMQLNRDGACIKGNQILMDNTESAYFWWDLSSDFVESIIELEQEGRIAIKPIDKMVYFVNGGKIPKEEIEVDGKTLVWEPTVIVLE